MYCPNCATPLAESAANCPNCNLYVAPIHMLLHASPIDAQKQRWNRQRHSLGLFMVMCSLLAGCLIPIVIGVMASDFWPVVSSTTITSVVLILSGVAGVLLFLGAMLILASEGTILNSNPPEIEPQLPRSIGTTVPHVYKESEPQPIKR